MSGVEVERILSRQNPFEANGVGESRLTWDASVHRWFSNTCVFFLFRYRQAPINILAQLQQILEASGISSFYAYGLLGHFDAIVRVWATPGKVAIFRNKIYEQQAGANVFLEAKEFQVQDIRIVEDDEDSHVVNPENVRDHTNLIHSVAKTVNHNQQHDNNGFRQKIQELIGLGLVHVASAESTKTEPYRFSIILQTEVVRSGELKIHDVAQWCRDAKRSNELIRSAVYRGIGYGEYLIAGIVPSLEGLNRFSLRVRTQLLSNRSIRTETYLAVSSDAKAIDAIDPEQADADPVHSRLLNFLAHYDIKEANNYQIIFSRLSRETQAELTRVFREAETSLNTPFERFLHSFLLARFLNDSTRLGTALSCLAYLEGLVCDWWTHSWQTHPNPGIRLKELKEVAENMKLNDFDPKKPSLAQIIAVVGKLRSKGETDPLTAAVGGDWVQTLNDETVRMTRNDFAHGRVFVREDYVESKWSKIANVFGDVGRLFNKIVELCPEN
ncbi:MAG: hypothetical protein R3E01_04130 [Pirellulaceae bacterium]